MDPYVKVKFGDVERITEFQDEAGKEPYWNDVLSFRKSNDCELISFDVMDKDIGKSDDLVGSGSLSINSILKGDSLSAKIELMYKGQKSGDLYVDADFFLDRCDRSLCEMNNKSGLLEFKPVSAVLTRDVQTIGKMSPFAEFILSKNSRFKTEIANEAGKNPVWVSTPFQVQNFKQQSFFDLRVGNQNLTDDIGCIVSQLPASVVNGAKNVSESFEILHHGASSGQVMALITYQLNSSITTQNSDRKNGMLLVNLQFARLNEDKDLFGSMTSFVKVVFERHERRSRECIVKGMNPVYNDCVSFRVENEGAQLACIIYKVDSATNFVICESGQVQIEELLSDGGSKFLSLSLTHNGKQIGHLYVYLEYITDKEVQKQYIQAKKQVEQDTLKSNITSVTQVEKPIGNQTENLNTVKPIEKQKLESIPQFQQPIPNEIKAKSQTELPHSVLQAVEFDNNDVEESLKTDRLRHEETFQLNQEKQTQFYDQVQENFQKFTQKIDTTQSTAGQYLGVNSQLKKIISCGLVTMYKQKPTNPIRFLGQYFIDNS